MTKRFILLFTLALSAGMMVAQDPVEIEDFALTEETIAEDTLLANTDSMAIEVEANPDPDWYVAPLDYDSVMARHNAPRRAAAANSCPIDSVLTFDVDSVLTDVSIYEHGDTTRTITWAVNHDGSRVGKKKEEYVYDATGCQIDSAIYAWDNTTHSWYGTAKTECTYETSKMTSRTEFSWLNGAWAAQKRFTYAYDEAGRETEYILYERNAITGSLDPSKCRIRIWYNNSNVTLVILYTAYTNGAWSAGTKYEYVYDSNGNQTEYTYYSAFSDGNWVNSTHELWTYISGKKTNYEKYTWSNGDWVGTSKETWTFNATGKQTRHEKFSWSTDNWAIILQENSGYDDSGNQNLVENYNISNNVWSGSKKEEYEFSGKTKIGTTTYSWVNGAWVYKKRTISNTVSNPNESCVYNWKNGAWVGSGNRTLTTKNSGKETEKIIQTWSATEKDWVNKTRDTTAYSGSNITQKASYKWQNDAWIGTSRTDYHYTNGKNDTIKTYTNDGTNWIYSKRTINTFNASGTNIMTHISNWDGEKWVLASMTRTDIVNKTVDGIRQTCTASWKCGSDSIWKGVEKDTAAYSATGKQIYKAIYDTWANSAWVAYYKVEYEYDELDRKTLEQRFDWNVNMWKGNYRNEYGFDEQGRQVMTAKYTGWNSATNSWIGTSKTEQTFYPNNQIASSIASVWGTDTWRQVFRYTYIYDDAGRTIKETTEHYENNQWVYTDKTQKEYKGSILVKNNTYQWLGGQWIFSSRNETYYDEDTQEKNRRTIIGSWNNGDVVSFADNLYFYDCDHPYFTIRFENYDGSLLQSTDVKETKKPIYKGETPTKPATAQYTYTFKGWKTDITPAIENTTYVADYDSVVNSYIVTWLNDDNTQIDQTQVAYGIVPTHDDPTKASTAEYMYIFTGWDKEVVAVTEDATYKATFSTAKNKFTITWLYDDDSQIDQTQVEYGIVPTHDDPTKTNTAEYTYTFTGWDKDLVAATGNATYKATFTATKNSYLITWLNDDNSQLDQTQVEYGEVPVYTGATPTKEATAEFSYTFAGWTTEPVAVTGDATYKATFSSTKNQYTITWLNDDDSQIDQTQVEYGIVPTHDDPTKQSTAEYTYTFTGWDKTVVAVTGDATYKATFSASKNQYTVTWLYDDGSQIDQTTVEYGVIPTHDDPTKPATAEYTFTFTGWDKEITAVTGEATYTAVFDSVVNTYTIIFYYEDGVTEMERVTVEYGQIPATTVIPSIQGDEHYTYEFAGWSPEIQPVTGEATYTATFTATPRTYAITFKNYNGVLLQTIQVAYGEVPVYSGETPSKPTTAKYTYVFSGWDKEITAVTGDATYTAVFESIINTYTVIFYNEDGTELDRVEVEYGKMPTYTGETPTKADDEEYTYTFVGWTPKLKTVTGDAAYTATYTAAPKGQGLDQINDQSSATKVMINGTIYILRAGKTYTVDGVLVE